ncbi:MAG: thiamine diphosphokinase [Paracoccaceae bacterium]
MGKARDFFRVRMWIVSKNIVNCGMIDLIVQTSENVTLVGASKINKGILTSALAIAPYLVAADGGAELLLKCGEAPKKVIGDFDSISPETLKKLPQDSIFRISEQETTDFDKCLQHIESPLILGIGFLGGRVDHQFAAFNTLVCHPNQRCILIGKRDIVFHLPAEINLNLSLGSRLSLFPMAAVSGASEGLRWPISGLHFAPDGRIGTSNEVNAKTVSLKMHRPGMLAILPRAALAAVVAALKP